MQKNSLIKLIFSLFFLFTGLFLWGQDRDSSWTLPKCIDQAMEKNISIQGKVLNNNTNLVDWEETKAKRLPSLNASVSQNFEWSRSLDLNNNYKPYAGSNGTNFGINSSLNLYNGFKTKNSIKQAELSYKAGNYDVETLKFVKKENLGLIL